MRVLISRLSAMGDVVCSLPIAGAVKSTWPESEVTWIVDRRFRGIVDLCTHVNHVVERPQRPWDVRSLGEFDLAVDAQGLFKSGVLVGLSRAKQKLGYHWQREGAWLFSRRVLPDPTSLHVVDQYVDIVRAAGASDSPTDFGLVPDAGDLEAVRARLTEQGWAGGPLVLCNAGAGWVTKRWHPASFAALADRLATEGLSVAFLGAPSDREVFDEVRQCGASKAMDMVGRTNIRELVALASLCAVHVGGDTGSTHIAAALGRPAVGIYCVTRPERSCPYGQIDNCFVGQPDVGPVFERTMDCVKLGATPC